MTLTRKIILLLTTFLIYGCQTIYYPALDVDEAILFSPNGEFRFEVDKEHEVRLISYDGEYHLSISLFPINKENMLKILPNTENITIDSENTYYQLNDGEMMRLDISKNWYYHNLFKIKPPETMDKFYINGGILKVFIPGKGTSKISSEIKNKMQRDTYRYHIAFNISKEAYVIDTTFRLDSGSYLTIGVPVTP